MNWTPILQDGFEGTFEDYQGIGELTVPKGWRPVWTQGTEPGKDHRPECDREVIRVRSGSAAAKMFSTHASHTGALARRVQVQAGTLVRAVAHGATFGIEAGHGLVLGIDPEGGLDPEAEGIEWSSWWGQYNKKDAPPYNWEPEKYHEFSVAAQAPSDFVTVFLYSHSDYAASTVAAYWDDVLVEQEGDTPGPDPEPTGDLIGVLEEIRDVLIEIKVAIQSVAIRL